MLFLQTFGGLSLLDDEQRVVVCNQRRRLAILALLAVAGERGLSRDKLLAYLWPEQPADNARHALHQLLYYLRRDCHPELFVGTDPLRLNGQVVTSDIARFTSALSAGSLDGAVALYTGSFLDGFFISGAAEFEKWLEIQRARLQADYAGALYRLARSADECASHVEAIERWRALAAVEPFDARATLGLMRALVAAGNPIGAIRQARIYENLVREEMGQACAPEIVTYVNALRTAGAGTASGDGTLASSDARAAGAQVVWQDEPVSPRRRPWRSRVPVTALAVALLLIAVGAGYTALQRDSERSRAAAVVSDVAAPAVAVMPFGVNDPALTTWSRGALVLLAAGIDGVAGLRAIDPQTVLASLRETAGSASDGAAAPDRSLTLVVARRTGARHAVVGQVVTIGNNVRITADVYQAINGRRLRQLQIDGTPDRIFALLDAIAVDVLRTILGDEGLAADAARVKLARTTTSSLPALKAYLEAEDLYQQSRFKEAAALYERALEADSTFALMFSRFLVPYSFVSEAAPASVRDPLAHALGMLDRLPRRETLLVRASQQLSLGRLLDAFELLRQASREYPDDYEVWYSLGEVALHGGGSLLLPADEALRAFGNAVQLNPAFGPPYGHLIELTLGQRGEKARAAQLNAVYERIAPAADNLNWGRWGLALASAKAGPQSDALAALAAQPLAVTMQLAKYLSHPDFRAAQERVLGIVTARASEQNPGDHAFAAEAFMARGKLSAAIASSLRPGGCPPLWIYWAFMYGKTQLAAEEEAMLRPGAESSRACAETAAFVAGAYAADRTMWAGVDSAQNALRELADQKLSAADSTAAQQLLLLARALHGYQLARAGRVEAGMRLLRAVQPRLTSNNAVVRWWLAELLFQSGQPHAARAYFASFWTGHGIVPASYYLGRIDEQLGHAFEARAAYARFADGWREADLEMQPRLADARARLARLHARDRAR